MKNKFALSLIAGVLILAGCNRANSQDALAQQATKETAPKSVGCFGRVLPEKGSFFVSPHILGGISPVVERLEVKAGDEVAPGQEIARLSSMPYLQQAVESAEKRVSLASARLALAKAGGPVEQISAAEDEVRRLEVEKQAAAVDYERNRALSEKGYLAKAQLEAFDNRRRETEILVAQAKEKLHEITNKRREDVAVAEAQVQVAEADLARARQDLGSAVVRAPSKACVLRVVAHPGETVGPQGIAELAGTESMEVVAEVYENDIPRVRVGQKATIASELLPKPIEGSVVWISPQIQQQEPVSSERGAPADARIFKVRIHVDDQSILAARVGARVNIVIQP